MILSVTSLLLAVYCVVAIVLYFMQPRLTFRPVKKLPCTPKNIGLDYEKVRLTTPDDLILDGWYVPAKDAAATVLFCHANGGNMGYYIDTIDILNKLGLNCFIFDYRGYGNSEGRPSENGLYIDAQTAYNWLVKEKNAEPQSIIIFGRSLGGTVAAKLASNVRAGGLIVESSFTSYADIAQKFYPYIMVRPFVKYSFDTVEYIKKVECPILIIHSRSDDVIPFEFGLRLYAAAAGMKEFLEICGGHNDGFLYSGQIYREGLAEWLEFVKKLLV